MQYIDLAIVLVASVSWEHNLHLLGIESNPGGENRSNEVKTFTGNAFNPCQPIEAGRH